MPACTVPLPQNLSFGWRVLCCAPGLAWLGRRSASQGAKATGQGTRAGSTDTGKDGGGRGRRGGRTTAHGRGRQFTAHRGAAQSRWAHRSQFPPPPQQTPSVVQHAAAHARHDDAATRADPTARVACAALRCGRPVVRWGCLRGCCCCLSPPTPRSHPRKLGGSWKSKAGTKRRRIPDLRCIAEHDSRCLRGLLRPLPQAQAQ
jgi:hypothetical protein